MMVRAILGLIAFVSAACFASEAWAREYDPRTGRFIQNEPVLRLRPLSHYTYGDNNPVQNKDPMGLWTWRMDETGRVIAVSEAGDTINSLFAFGYKTLEPISAVKLDEKDKKLDKGVEIDVSANIPEAVRKVLKEQQAMAIARVAGFLSENVVGKPKPGSTIGTSGLDPAAQGWGGWPLGWGQCYGFVGVYLGYKIPEGVDPRNFALMPQTGEALFPEANMDPNSTLVLDYGEYGGKYGMVTPKGGLAAYLMQGKKVASPILGDVAVFMTIDGGKPRMAHAAIALGTSQDGTPYVIQKRNQCEPYSVSSVKHPHIGKFGTPEYYRR